MKFTPLRLAGAYLVDIVPLHDERGFFARTWCHEDFEALGLTPPAWVQCNTSLNLHKGTLRGMHYQVAPHEEVKLVRCTMGAIYDVIVDIRPNSPTYLHWEAVELTADNRRSLYIPFGFAHGYQTLADHSEVCYQVSEFYHPECARGLRWNDPTLAIQWPLDPAIISDRDQTHEFLQALNVEIG